ncbi:MAG: class II fumarate hydratase, partial [Dehalococcoidia bacterium]|nr:class II fumarate hydratase [Dehalococcoidia bacterium]
IQALGVIKASAARANMDLELLDPEVAKAIAAAAMEVAAGRWDSEFVVDVFQTGSGTSTNMNANEVIANRANEILGGSKGAYSPVHPNDQVNRSQSSNDVIPTAIHLSALLEYRTGLLPALYRLETALKAKSVEFHGVIKTGRTHLMDATPIRLGQEFEGYAGQIEQARRGVSFAAESLREVALGGTAVGTGVNAPREFARRTLGYVNQAEKVQLRETPNHFRAQSSIDASVAMSGALRATAVAMIKIANDIRLMGSGPRAGLYELALPALQPGSSIMPGKVNPVIPEAVVQVGAQVIGNDAAIAAAGQWGFFELNTMLPVAARNLLESIRLLSNVATAFSERCIVGLETTGEGPRLLEQGLAIVTPLANVIGYDRASMIAKEAFATRRTVREVAGEMTDLGPEELDRLLDPAGMVDP